MVQVLVEVLVDVPCRFQALWEKVPQEAPNALLGYEGYGLALLVMEVRNSESK
jgi:hypothetical protein